MVRRRGGRKRALGLRRPIEVPRGPNQRWSLDFVSDQLTDGRRFRILAVVDDFTRECLALQADTSLSGRRVARVLDDLVQRHGRPAGIPPVRTADDQAFGGLRLWYSLRMRRTSSIPSSVKASTPSSSMP